VCVSGQRTPLFVRIISRIRQPAVIARTRPDGGRRLVVKGAPMGDKGGKKDKEKNLQQNVKKHQQKEKDRTDKARQATAPMPSRQTAR
jgi:hypothetical protein